MLDLLGVNGLSGVLGGIALAIIGAFVAYMKGRNNGASKERQDAMEEDYENADDIRHRVGADRAKRMRELDDAGFRD